MAKRSITTEFTEEDAGIETTLRPKFLKDYIGQEKVKGNLKIYIEAAKQRGEALDHVRDLEKQRLQALSQMRWELILK